MSNNCLTETFDWSAWITRLRTFVAHVQAHGGVTEVEIRPVLTEEEFESLQRSLPDLRLPSAYREFLRFASSGVRFEYEIVHPASASQTLKDILAESIHCKCRLCWSPRLVSDVELLRGMARDFGEPESDEADWISEIREAWTHSLPLGHVFNGDRLVLDLRMNANDPRVLYLSHEDDTCTEIAPTFTAFLSAWEQMGYIGPELWVLEPFFDGEGHLSTNGEAAQELRRLLGIEQ